MNQSSVHAEYWGNNTTYCTFSTAAYRLASCFLRSVIWWSYFFMSFLKLSRYVRRGFSTSLCSWKLLKQQQQTIHVNHKSMGMIVLYEIRQVINTIGMNTTTEFDYVWQNCGHIQSISCRFDYYTCNLSQIPITIIHCQQWDMTTAIWI